MLQINHDLIMRSFPWALLFDDLGYQMPYPDVLMTSDRAYALHTQVSALLLDLVYDPAFRAEVAGGLPTVQLGAIDEAWAYIGVDDERLLRYMQLSTLTAHSATAQ